MIMKVHSIDIIYTQLELNIFFHEEELEELQDYIPRMIEP